MGKSKTIHTCKCSRAVVILYSLICIPAVCVKCVRGYFRWGEILRKHWLNCTFQMGGNFPEIYVFPILMSLGCYFHAGDIFAVNTQSRKLLPCEIFNILSTCNKPLRFNITFRNILGTNWQDICPVSKFRPAAGPYMRSQPWHRHQNVWRRL